MTNDEYKRFGNTLIKQGNSFCVRVPSMIVKEINAKTGDLLDVRVKKQSMESNEKNINPIFKKLRQIKKLEYMDDERLLIMSIIYFNEGKSYMGTEIAAVIGGQKPKDIEKLSAKTTKMIEDYNKKIKNNYGEKLYAEYIRFKSIVELEIKKHDGLNW